MEKLISIYEVKMPRWEITDPFGRGAIRKARYEFKRKACECEGYRTQLEEIFSERATAVNKLVEELYHEQKVSAELNRRLAVCDDARKNLGDKINALTEEKYELCRKIDELELELRHERDLNKSIRTEMENLEIAHEKLLRGMTDKTEEVDG